MDKPIFVARERELTRLDALLKRTLSGRGQICFVRGEAGSGKTALIQAFSRRAQRDHADLVIATGQCDAQTGIGDAYLPFREILAQLTGDVEADLDRGTMTKENAGRLRGLLSLSGQALVEVGPDLIGIFLPGAGLAMRVGGFLAEKAGWLEKMETLAQKRAGDPGLKQDHIFEQYTNFLITLAEKQALILVLDDLQWADDASIALLFRLGRRLENRRIFLLGAFRPDEVSLGRDGSRHPLEKVQAEFERYFGDICLDLPSGRESGGTDFVEALIDSEPNLLDDAFRKALVQHTGGHPLFTIELLRDMQERGDLVRDAQGRWVKTTELNWAILPARVEGVIQERIGRLEAGLRDILTVGCVEGEDFTAEVVAGIQSVDTRALVRKLSGALEKQHRLVAARGLRRLEGRRLSLYRFQHNLFQAYLYGTLDPVERALLHEEVGTLLEALYGQNTDEIAVQLAHHFVHAELPEKARLYLEKAGRLAAARYANKEALDYLSRALEMTPFEELEDRYDLLKARFEIFNLKGDREAQIKDLDALEVIAESLNDNQKLSRLALSRSKYAGQIGDYQIALTSAKKAVKLAQSIEDVTMEASGHDLWGKSLRCQGLNGEALAQLQKAITLSKKSGARRTEASSLNSIAIIHISSGNFPEAIDCFEKAHHIFQETGDRNLEIIALSNLAAATREGGDIKKAKPYYIKALRIAREIGEVFGQSAVMNNLGNHHEELGDFSKALFCQEKALDLQQRIKDINGEASSFANLGRIFIKLGKYKKSLSCFEKSLSLSRRIGDRLGESFGMAFQGLLHHQMGNNEGALENNHKALNLAREIGAQNAQPFPLTFLGHAFAALHRYAEAEDSYQQALDLRREFGQAQLAQEPLAGLAQVALQSNDLPKARDRVEQILDHLKGGTLDGCEEPLRIYLAIYRVLASLQDPRAVKVLDTAIDKLQKQAERIGDEILRTSFLTQVPANREIIRLQGTV